MNIKTLRQQLGLTQSEASSIVDIPLRTYKEYENNPAKVGTIKYDYILRILQDKALVDEDHGILTFEKIQTICASIFKDKDVDCCILFGSYARGKATEKSDIDLLISTNITGLKYYGLVEELREKLHKRIDALDIRQLEENMELLNNILKEGIRIYVKG